MNFGDWRNSILCYLSADSFEPEVLKARLHASPGWREEFRLAFEAALAANNFNIVEWQRDLNFQFGSDRELRAWLEKVFKFLFASGGTPTAPGQ
ncbi:MAG: hypothetical protein KDD95_02080 [Rhodobacteraceae bacterium]|nr:hypothetical protein [Paracoccaceae bacterium]MCB2157422.1 hypothetical protein [Paracoccaceae bacterium]